MSRIDELIGELCPHGVRHEPLRHVARIRNGKDYKSLEAGDVPVYGSGGVMTTVDTAVHPGPSVLIPRKGSLNKLYYVDAPFWTVDTIFYTEIDDSRMVPKFLYYFLATQRLEELNQAGGVPSLTQTVLNVLRIPVPPLEVQREIVRVLDAFTQLEAELEAELEARRRQYAHYRDSLLTFTEGGVRWVPMGELLREPLANGRSVPDGSGYPVLRLTALHGPVVDASQHKLGAWDEEAGSRFRIEAGDLLVVRGNGSKDLIARACMVERSEEVAFPDTMIRVRPNLEQVSQRYLFHIWESRATRSRIERIAKPTSGVWKISQDDIARVELPVPSVDEQARIVAILDRFDALVNDLSSGLPAELAARRRQYEHYRDRLLIFKEAAA